MGASFCGIENAASISSFERLPMATLSARIDRPIVRATSLRASRTTSSVLLPNHFTAPVAAHAAAFAGSAATASLTYARRSFGRTHRRRLTPTVKE